MKQNNSNLLYHLVAFVTVAIWGTTFVSTKVLMLTVLAFNLVGDGLRDAFDPKMKR